MFLITVKEHTRPDLGLYRQRPQVISLHGINLYRIAQLIVPHIELLVGKVRAEFSQILILMRTAPLLIEYLLQLALRGIKQYVPRGFITHQHLIAGHGYFRHLAYQRIVRSLQRYVFNTCQFIQQDRPLGIIFLDVKMQ